MRVPTYSHLVGWRTLIDRLIHDIDLARGVHAGEYYELKEKYGSLRLGIDWPLTVPSDVVDRIEALIEQAETSSEGICIDCGAPAILYDWNGYWIAPCCPTHARSRAMTSTAEYKGDGWRLGSDFKLYDTEQRLLSADAVSQLDGYLEGMEADTWRAAKWLTKR